MEKKMEGSEVTSKGQHNDEHSRGVACAISLLYAPSLLPTTFQTRQRRQFRDELFLFFDIKGLELSLFRPYWAITDSNGGRTQNPMAEEPRISGFISCATKATFLTLIPKNKNSNSFFDFRPISLCNSIYKMISKLLKFTKKFKTKNIIFLFIK